MEPKAALQHIQALHVQEMQHVDEDPVFGQFIALTAIYVHYTHIRGLKASGHAHITAFVTQGQIGPAEEFEAFFKASGYKPGIGAWMITVHDALALRGEKDSN